MDKPGRHIMLDNLLAGITDEEIKYLLLKIGCAKIYKLLVQIQDED